MDWQIPLLVSALAFAAFMVFKLRPAWGSDRRAGVALLADAKKRVDAAGGDPERALAFADAGDACAKLGRANAAVRFYLNALQITPSAAIVDRAADALARRPRALERMMWRLLATTSWSGPTRETAVAALRALVTTYERMPRRSHRAQALSQALQALTPAP